MQKCTKCGTEFEGNFCPNCGATAEARMCPNCGAKIDGTAKFCSGCGFRFAEAQQPAPPQQSTQPYGAPRGRDIIYTILHYLPMAFGALFALLLFAFFAAPLVKETLFDESLGNVYNAGKTILEDMPELSGAIVALWIGLVIMLLVAAVCAVTTFQPRLNKVWVSQKGFAVTVSEICEAVLCAGLLMFLILSAVIMGKIKAFDEGMGMVKSGAGTILMLVFSILFLVFSVGAIVGRFYLGRYDSTAGAKVRRYKKEAVERAAEERAALQVELQDPATVARIQTCKRPYNYDEKFVCKLRRGKLIGMPIAGCLFALFGFSLQMIEIYLPYIVTCGFIGVGIAMFFTVLAMLLSCNAKCSNAPDAQRAQRASGLAVLGWLCLISGVVIVSVFSSLRMGTQVKAGIIGLLPYAFLVLYYFVVEVYTAMRSSHIKLHYYGTKTPNPEDAPQVEQRILEETAAYRHDKALRKVYVWQGGTLPKQQGRLSARSVALGVIAVCLAAVLITSVVIVPQQINPLSLKNIESLTAADYADGVDYRFGNLHRHIKTPFMVDLGKQKSPEQIEKEHASGLCGPDATQYFSRALEKLVTRADKIAAQMEAATEKEDMATILSCELEMNEIAEKIIKGKFTALTIAHTNQNGYAVSLDTRFGAMTEKRLQSIRSAETVTDSSKTLYYYRAYYTDGSYRYTAIPETSVESAKAGDGIARWSDDWGEYELEITN